MTHRSAALEDETGEHAENPDRGDREHHLPSPSHVRFALVTTREAFDRLAAEWTALFERAGRSHQVFQSFGWNWHWCNHYLSDDMDLCVVTGWQGDRLIMVWPLITERAPGLKVLTWMGEPVSQYGDVLIDDIPDAREVLHDAYAYLIATAPADLVWLQRVRDDALIAPLIAEHNGLPFNRRCAPYLKRDDAVDLEERSARARKKRRALAKRRAKLGETALVYAADSAQAQEVAALTIDWKRAQLHDRGIVSPAFDQRLAKFFADATSGRVPCGCRTVLVTADGAPAAGGIFLVRGDHFAGHVIAYDPKFEKAGAGTLLLEQTAQDQFEEGVGTFDLLPPGDTYKLRLASSSVDVADWAMPLTWKGRAFANAYLGMIRPAAKRAITALPAGLRQRIARAFLNRGG